jgi:hypothetical protein
MKNKLDYWYFLGKQIASDRIVTQSIIEKVEDKRKFLFFPYKTKEDFEIADIQKFFDDKEISFLLVSMLAFCDDGDCLMLQSHEDNPNS